MSDVPIDPPPDGGATEVVAWYARPIFWIVAAVVAAIIILVIVLLLSGDDDELATSDSSTTTLEETTTTVEETTTTVAETTTTVAETTTTVAETTTTVAETTTTVAETTTTVAETTTTVAGPEPVEVAESPLIADLVRADSTDNEMPFEDGEVEAQWYQSGGTYVVVYAGWDATQGEPQCPGSSIFSPDLDPQFGFISNSPQAPGACDPEDRYPLIIPLDDPMGVRVCGTLVLNHTIIPVLNDDGTMRDGDLYAGVERIVADDFVSSYGSVAIAGAVVAELDPMAAAYSVPDGWLPDGATTVSC
jgi:hypothetical protein